MKIWITAITLLLVGSVAYAYDTGSMSCEDIGQFSASVVEGKNKGATYKESLAKVDKLVPKKYSTERKNCKKIVKVLYKTDDSLAMSTALSDWAFRRKIFYIFRKYDIFRSTCFRKSKHGRNSKDTKLTDPLSKKITGSRATEETGYML